jgi:hypothetical protein
MARNRPRISEPFTAYYDASGSQSSPSGGLAVVGLVASVAKWSRFESDWDATLAEFGISAHHMRQFTGSSPGSEFAAWEGQEARRSRYLAQLVRALKRGMQKGFAVVVAPDALRRVNEEIAFGGNGYALAANLCRRFTEKWLEEKHPKATLEHVFEHGDVGQGVLRDELAFSDIVEGLHFQVKILPKLDKSGRRRRQFEAADLLSWEARRMVNTIELRFGGRPRRSLSEIARMLPMAGTTLTSEKILTICRKRPDLYPPITNAPTIEIG